MAQVRSLETGRKFKDTPIGKIPVDWEVSQIENICEVVGGTTPSTANEEYWNGDILWATPTDITNLKGRLIRDTKQKISEKGLKSSSIRLLPKDSILMTSRATIGACAVNTKPIATNQGFASLICHDNAHNWFIYYLILFFRKELERLGSGSTFREVSKKSVRSLNIPLPPLSEQKKIAEILSTVDDAIEETDKVIDKTKELKKGLMQKLLTRGIGHKKFKKTEIGEIPVEWDIVKLKDVTPPEKYSFVDGPFGSNLKTIHYTTEGVPVIQSQMVISGKFIPAVEFYVSSEKAKELERSKVVSGDIVIAKIGVNYGASATVPKEFPNAVLSGNTMKITPDTKKVITQFLQYILHFFRDKKVFDKIVSTTAQPAITLAGAKNLMMPLPDKKEQTKIAEILSSVDSEIENEEKKKSELESLKKSLMHVLLTGKVRVKFH